MPLYIESGLATSLASFQMPDGESTTNGSPSGAYLPVAGMQSIPCQDAPESIARIEATEKKTMEQIETSRLRHILLTGYYPQIPNGVDNLWIVIVQEILNGQVVDTNTWQVFGSEADSQTRMTRISARIYNV